MGAQIGSIRWAYDSLTTLVKRISAVELPHCSQHHGLMAGAAGYIDTAQGAVNIINTSPEGNKEGRSVTYLSPLFERPLQYLEFLLSIPERLNDLSVTVRKRKESWNPFVHWSTHALYTNAMMRLNRKLEVCDEEYLSNARTLCDATLRYNIEDALIYYLENAPKKPDQKMDEPHATTIRRIMAVVAAYEAVFILAGEGLHLWADPDSELHDPALKERAFWYAKHQEEFVGTG